MLGRNQIDEIEQMARVGEGQRHKTMVMNQLRGQVHQCANRSHGLPKEEKTNLTLM